MINNMNPYVGLRPFEMDESILFFGRSEQILQLLQRLHQHRFVSVVGSSGCGKSSLLKAGLIPALKAGYLVDDSDRWFIAIMKPGQNPLYNLAEALLKQTDPGSTEEQVLSLVKKIDAEGTDVLVNLLLSQQKKQHLNFFLLVDQFEELFRFAMDQKDAARKDEAIDFVNIILELTRQQVLPFYVVLTMRSDFIGDCSQFYGLPEAMNNSQYLVPRLNRMEMKMAIEGPAKLYGGKFNPSLTSKLLNDSGKLKDELPLLQHALMRMWDFENKENKSGEIDLIDYEKTGGIEKALNNHADEALLSLPDEDKVIAKKMFQSLTTIDNNGRKIRQPAKLSVLAGITGASKQQLLSICNRFIEDKRSFLIINKTTDPDDPVIDISHESLIRQWNRLSKWAAEEGENVQNLKRLSSSERFYSAGKKDLLSGNELLPILSWYKTFQPSISWASRHIENVTESFAYLLASETEMKKQQQEKERRKKINNRKRTALWLLAIAALTFIILQNESQTKKRHNELKKQNYLHLSQNARKQAAYLKELHYEAEALNLTRNSEEEIRHAYKLLPLFYLHIFFMGTTDPYWAEFDSSATMVTIWEDAKKSYTWQIIDTLKILDSSDQRTTTQIQQDPKPAVYHLLDKWDIDTITGNFHAVEINNWENITKLKVPGTIKLIDGGIYSNDKKIILIWGQNTEDVFSAFIFNSETGQQISTSLIHTGQIYGTAISHDNNKILTWSIDSTVRLWHRIKKADSIGADLDYPASLFKLQAQVLTGVELDPISNELKTIDVNKWIELSGKWNELSKKHLETCKYPKYNYWARAFENFPK
jgi:hypothetical protein